MKTRIEVRGIVQGVGFRPFVYRLAVRNGLKGYVQNRGDATVVIYVEGEKDGVDSFIYDLKNEKPPLTKIYTLTTSKIDEERLFRDFRILSSSESGESSGSIIPPDISICKNCVRELKNPRDRRYDYFFVTCTDCGPRFTTIERLPYDRLRTTMKDFPMCPECGSEYTDPLNRRFHAQTIACQRCGPKAFLTTNGGEEIDVRDPIREAGRLVGEGYIVAVKGNGGFHIATATTSSDPILRLRRTKHRAQKPFAVMARNLDTVRSFALLDRYEEELLTSYIKPIVLLKKSESYYLSEHIAPQLHNIGVMLPYTGLHILLFDQTDEPAFVMTSGNPPGEPIVIENDEAFRRLGSEVDYFLLHNRRIAQRCDDSVVRMIDRDPAIIRRSRGYAPEPIHLKNSVGKRILGLGGELNVTSCLLLDDRAYISQHIGDVEQAETYEFLKESYSHLISLTKGGFESIACDLHPKFLTTRLAEELGDLNEADIVSVQHHQAHINSLMGEYSLDEMIGISCDGVGYGCDGKIWGGEVLLCNRGQFERLAHLEEHPMPGGDLATRYPLRMAAGILFNTDLFDDWLDSVVDRFPYGERESEVLRKQLVSNRTIRTTSCGRVLDAVSAVTGICSERTYEGEPAMKLEGAAVDGRDILQLKPSVDKNILCTDILVEEVVRGLKRYSVRDLAFSAQKYLAQGLAELAIEKALELNVKTVGFSGGVAYNEHITLTIKRRVEESCLRFVTNRLVPPGDGGLSFGQVIAASHLIQ